jgi:hypothetical protein
MGAWTNTLGRQKNLFLLSLVDQTIKTYFENEVVQPSLLLNGGHCWQRGFQMQGWQMDNHPPKHRINIIRKTPGAVKLSV